MKKFKDACLINPYICIVRSLHLRLLITLTALIVSGLASAQQSSFSKSHVAQHTEFTYKWRNHGKEYQLNFGIDTATLYAMPPSPPNYSQKVFQDNVYLKVMYAASQIDATLANIDIKKNHSGLSFNVSSRQPKQAQRVLNKLKLAHDQAQDDYWSENFFLKYTSPAGADGIRHDHAKYTVLSSPSLKPIVDAISKLQSNSNDPQEFIEIALGWIQSIPYDRLEDRLSSNGAGFLSPRDLLLQNQGDCDSKSTLMAALLKAYSSRADVQMVFLPEHALLAVNMRGVTGDMTLNYKGQEYVLLEPTGPAQLPLGEVADSSKLSLRNRQFDLSTL